MMNAVAVIPSRYQSTRFPGKPLALIANKPMIQWVYENTRKAVEQVWVATDDRRIYDAVYHFGGRAVMTSDDHINGTSRIAEAITKIEDEIPGPVDIVINVQGDEPFIDPLDIHLLNKCFDKPETDIATLIKTINHNDVLFNHNNVKVVVNTHGHALYFSRAVIPHIRDYDEKDWVHKHHYYKHLGIYAYRREVLGRIVKLKTSSLEMAESLEQNRWLENGYTLATAITEKENLSVDTPDDLEEIDKLIAENRIQL